MKYRLINTATNEEHLCDKVTIDGFDYYVSDEGASYLDTTLPIECKQEYISNLKLDL